MKISTPDNKENSIDNSNPNPDNNWLENLKNTPLSFGKAEEVDTCNGKDFDFFFIRIIRIIICIKFYWCFHN